MVKTEAIVKDISFLFLRNDLLAVLLYGSVVKDEDTPRSDIDICLVAPCLQRQSRFAQGSAQESGCIF